MGRSREQERAELYRTLWSFANEVRGQVDGWDFKQYVLVLLFYRYISEYIEKKINGIERRAGDLKFDYTSRSDDEVAEIRDSIIQQCGFFIYPSELFRNVAKKAEDDENLNITLAEIFRNIEKSAAENPEAKDRVKGLFDDVNLDSNKLGKSLDERNRKIVRLLTTIGSMDFGEYGNGTIDVFGDAYEYLMGLYASNAGKAGGEYFTPPEVSLLLNRLAIGDRKDVRTFYDPACGSGSLLLQAKKVLRNRKDIRFYGQEVNITTYNLCRINMFLHDVNYSNFDIRCGDTLTDPLHEDCGPFDVVASNPPYSLHWRTSSNESLLMEDRRYAPAGILAPKSYADMAFILHCLSCLSEDGTAAIVCFPGVMYRGGAEQKIRKYLVNGNYVDAVIRMPENLFFGTTVPVNLLILKKNRPDSDVMFIDASNEFVKVTNSNMLTQENMDRICGWYEDRKKVPHRVRIASRNDIEAEKYTLSVSSYVEPEDTREKIDIRKLNAEIDEVVRQSDALRLKIKEIIEELEADEDFLRMEGGDES